MRNYQNYDARASRNNVNFKALKPTENIQTLKF